MFHIPYSEMKSWCYWLDKTLYCDDLQFISEKTPLSFVEIGGEENQQE